MVPWCVERTGRRGADFAKLVPELLKLVAGRENVDSFLKSAQVTPYIDVLIAQSGKFELKVKWSSRRRRRRPYGAERGGLQLHTEYFDLSATAGATQTPQGTSPSGN